MPDPHHLEPATDLIPCPVCGTYNQDAPNLPHSQGPWNLKQCKTCGMVYLENAPSYEALADDFEWDKTFHAESDRRAAENPVARKLTRKLKASVQKATKRDKLMALMAEYVAPGPVLDVGCAGGHTFRTLPPQYIPFGIEISPVLAAQANALFAPRGGTVVQADALTGLHKLPEHHFTGVVMTSFLEHDKNAKDTLLALHRVLRPDAAIIIKVPNYASWNRLVRGPKWCGYRFPDHVSYFTPTTLQRLLTATNFTTARFQLADHLPTSDTMWLVARPGVTHL